MKAVVAAFNQEKALVGAFSVIVKPVVEPMDRFAALLKGLNSKDKAGVQEDEISEVMEYLFVNDAASGDVIIQQGDEGDNFYIIDQVQHMQHAVIF